MNGVIILVIGCVALLSGYLYYGRRLAKKWGVDPSRKTPAYEFEDGVDYVPTDSNILFGHQFASIAGAAPIIGPIAASGFGWLPVLLWCLIGGVFFGGVQDFGAMVASVKNEGHSLGFIIEKYLGKTGKNLFLLFCWLFCILVIAAFANIVAVSFGSVAGNEALTSSNGSTAMTSCLFIGFAVAFGFFARKVHPGTVMQTIIAIVLLVVAITIGLLVPITSLTVGQWTYIIFAYILVASVVPVWALLQPRDYLNSFLLIFMIAAAVLGIFVAHPSMKLPAVTTYVVGGQSMFPFLFVTIACGAVSGFHALVSSNTSSKQIKSEKDMLKVSYGAMLVESLLAVIALVCVGSLGGMPKGISAQQTFAMAIANFLDVFHVKHSLSLTLINLAISAFALTSLDSVARIARLSFQELFTEDGQDPATIKPVQKLCQNSVFATVLTLILGYVLSKGGYLKIWALFGSSNQMLSALALSAVAVYLKKAGKDSKNVWIPMIVMMAVTFTALMMLNISNIKSIGTPAFEFEKQGMQLIFGIFILILGILISVNSIRTLFFSKDDKAKA
ncbi:MAG: carbon starvation protein A [Spirochaetia bacterium]|jgi:carbon starvation protein|nr:carbon starvation protein A [Spirochaetia bacterium]